MIMTNTKLTDEQKQAVDDMVTRRMTNTGETQVEATDHIIRYLKGLASVIENEINN